MPSVKSQKTNSPWKKEDPDCRIGTFLVIQRVGNELGNFYERKVALWMEGRWYHTLSDQPMRDVVAYTDTPILPDEEWLNE